MTPEQVREARELLGVTQEELAKVMGLRGGSSISEWERGDRNPNGRSVRLLQAYLDGYRPADWPTDRLPD